MKPPVSWRAKLAAGRAHQVKPVPVDIAGMRAGQVMLVPSPALVDAFIRGIPKGSAMDVRTLRRRLAADFGAEVTCPITLGFHLRTVAEAAFEALADGTPDDQVTPVWRVLDAKAPTTAKLSGGPAFILERRRAEGLD